MSIAPDGEHRKPTAFIATFNYLAADEETDENFKQIMKTAFKVAVNKVLDLFGDRIEIIDPDPRVPETELKTRDEV